MSALACDVEREIDTLLQSKPEEAPKDDKSYKVALTKTLNIYKNKIYVSEKKGTENIQEAKKFLLPVCKLLVLGPEPVESPVHSAPETPLPEKIETEPTKEEEKKESL